VLLSGGFARGKIEGRPSNSSPTHTQRSRSDEMSDETEVPKDETDLSAGEHGSKESGVLESVSWFVRQITTLAGLRRLSGFDLRSLFAEVIGRHTSEDIEEFFMVGSRRTTPPIENIETGWPKPWIFFRAFLGTLIVFLFFQFAWSTFQNRLLIPGLIMTGSFAMPISTLIFFVEMNARRNVSMYQVSKMVVVGGLLSMIMSLLLFEVSDVFSLGWLGGSVGGLVEEPAKVMAMLLVASMTRYRYILNGLLFGAAVGAGFAAFESAGYAFIAGVVNSDPDLMTTTILFRGLLSPLGHIVWSAMCGAALWMVKKDQLFRFSMFLDLRFLRIFGIAVVLHMIWNAPIDVPFLGRYLLVGLVGWIVVLALISEGLQELRAELEKATDHP
jgi:RsiW-degrading membrane proteinase PrsW (M82 family)